MMKNEAVPYSVVAEIARIVAALAILESGAALAQEDVKIGVAAPLTGAQPHYGKDFENGIQLATEDFNNTNPVIAGKHVRIVLDVADDQADPRTATMVAQKLVDDGIKGMLGHFNSGTTIPASRIYARANIPEVALATAAEYTQQGFNTTFRMMTSDTQQGAVDGDYAVRALGFRKIAIVDDRTAYGQGLADRFANAAQKAGGTIVDREYTNPKAVDFKAISTKLKSMQADAIFFAGADAQAGPMVAQMRGLAMTGTLMAGEMVRTDAFLQIAGKAAEGTIASLVGQPLDEMPKGKEYAAEYKRRFGEEVQTYSPYAYDGATALFDAMKGADSTDPEKYLPFLSKIDISGVTGAHFAYDKRGDLRNGSVTPYKVVGGRWTPLQTVFLQ